MWNLDIKIKSKPSLKLTKAIDISDAIEKVFDYDKDKLEITLNSVIFDIPLVYVFSDLLDDFLKIIIDLIDSERGEGLYGFSQNDFFDADWILKWQNDLLVITPLWRYLKGYNIELLISEQIKVSKKDFLNSWKKNFIILSKYISFKDIIVEYEEQNEVIKRILNIK